MGAPRSGSPTRWRPASRAGRPWDAGADEEAGADAGLIVSRLSNRCYGPSVARTISLRELRNQSGEIMRGLDRGEEYTITHNGVPVGVLLPLPRRRFAGADTIAAAFAGAPSIDAGRLRADLDAVAGQMPFHP